FVSLLAGCGLVLDNSPADLKATSDASLDGGADGGADAEPPVECTLDTDCPADLCFGARSCVEGFCSYREPKDCSSLNVGTCVMGVCFEGECLAKPMHDLCDDGVECTLDQCSESGECFSEPSHAHCDDGVGCTADYCVVDDNGIADDKGCLHEPDDAKCAATEPVEGSCVATICTGSADTVDRTGCGEVVVREACGELDYCALDSGLCVPFPQGCDGNAACDDGNPCNGVEVCVDQVCFPGAEACPTSF